MKKSSTESEEDFYEFYNMSFLNSMVRPLICNRELV